jgi:hypothetical protein
MTHSTHQSHLLVCAWRDTTLVIRRYSLYSGGADACNRYTSDTPLATSCLEHLNLYQASIKNMHITDCNPLLVVGHQRRNLTAGFGGVDDKTLDFIQFTKHLSQTGPLESLSLIFHEGWNSDVSEFWHNHADPLLGHAIQTKALSYSGYMPTGFTAKASRLLDLSMITSLKLVDTNLWFLVNDLAPFVELCNLTRFQCYSRDSVSADEDFEVLHEFFERNSRLKHVYLSAGRLELLPICGAGGLDTESFIETTSYMWTLRDRLESLVWHDSFSRCYDCYGARCAVPHMGSTCLDFLCSNFAHLQQLGLQGEQPPNLLQVELATFRERLLEYLVSGDCHVIACLIFTC